MGINEVPPSSSRKSEKSRYSLDPWIQPQPFEVNRGQQEVSMKTTPGVQQRSDYSRQLSPQGALQMNRVQQEQSTSEEYDPFRTVRSFHRRQRELIAQSPILSTPSLETGGKRLEHVDNYSGFVQETPKPQRERREKRRTFQNNVRNPEPLDEISYIPRDSQSIRGQNFTEGNVNQLDLTSYMQLPPVGQDSKICGKCGEQGHVKRQCLANVTCDFCKTRSHATLACRTYANFMKEHPLTSSRKNTPERFHNELDVNLEVARRVELELRKWQRESGLKGKPPLPQSRKQQTIYTQQHLSQEPVYSQDIRVQMGERVHTEVHQSQHVKHTQRSYQPAINANNRFVTEEERNNGREQLDQTGRDQVDPERSQTMINANNRFIAEDGRSERRPMIQREADSVTFEPQRFQPMLKVNNRFIAENRRNYGRCTENGPVLFEQQNLQPAINANNRFIEESSRNYERGRPQQYDQDAVTGLQVQNNKATNRNITENYLMESTHLKLMKGPQSESTSNHITTNGNDVQDMAENYSQQAKRSLDVRRQDRIGENLINREFTERSQTL